MNKDIVSNSIYVLATGSLLIGSSLTFETKLPDYFYLVGSSLFFIKALLSFIDSCNTYNRNEMTILTTQSGYYVTI